MANKTEHHLEHVHEAGHHAEHNPFDRNVAMTMAIVAAALAFVTMLSHRAHNQTLILYSEANRLQTQANVAHTRATDEWAYYQAKNLREQQYAAYAELLEVLAKDPATEVKRGATLGRWEAKRAKYGKELPELQKKAESTTAEADRLLAESKKRLAESDHVHHRADRLDLAELAVELGLVLCSIAVLTKRAPFWYLGLASGVAGIGVTASAFVI